MHAENMVSTLAWALAAGAPTDGTGGWAVAGAAVSSVKSMASPASRAAETAEAAPAGGCIVPNDNRYPSSEQHSTAKHSTAQHSTAHAGKDVGARKTLCLPFRQSLLE